MMKHYCLTLCVVLGSVLLTGCRSYPVQSMPSLQVTNLRSQVTSDNAVFAAKAYVDGPEIERIFNEDLMSKGYLPVLFMVNNQGEDDIQIIKSQVRLKTGSGVIHEPLDPAVVSTKFGRNAMAEAFWFFGIFSYDNALKYNEGLERDWGEKSLPDIQFVRPGISLKKFLYYSVGKGYAPSGSKIDLSYRLGEQPKKKVSLDL